MKEGEEETTSTVQIKVPPSFKLRSILQGHKNSISSIAWSLNGEMLASTSSDTSIRLWDTQTGQHLRTLIGHSDWIYCVAWSPDGRVLASGSADRTIRLWNPQTDQPPELLIGHANIVSGIAWSPDGLLVASCSFDKTVQIWDPRMKRELRTLTGHTDRVHSVAWSPDGRVLASGSADKTIRLWDVRTGQPLRTLTGHSEKVYDVTWSPDGKKLISCSADTTIGLWNPSNGQQNRSLEVHTEAVLRISFSSDGRFLASKSADGTISIWNTDAWGTVALLEEARPDLTTSGLAFHPNAPVLATLDENDRAIRIWDLDFAALLRAAPVISSVNYTTAKIALVGDSGVGKSGLGYRIAKDNFLVTESTHGQQFWIIDKLGKIRDDGTQCEAVLWDFAGQPNFRAIHTLFLEDIDLALVLFDPSRQDTLTGVEYWLKHLSYKRQLCPTILVAARIDVSKSSFPTKELGDFCHKRNISGGVIATSAKTGEGVNTLLDRIRQQIDWNTKPATVTTETFKRIKDYVLAIKSDANRKNVLVSLNELRTQLEATNQNRHFTDANIMASDGHLQNHGYVTILRRTSNEQSILLAPDILINLAGSYMLKGQSDEKGLGALEELRALRNEYKFPEVEHISAEERDTLLNAVTELFLNRNICFRESIDNQTYLIFPSLILDRPPHMSEDADLVEDISYTVTGQVENIYPALVVLLGYAPSYQRTYQWRKQAQYQTVRGEICSFKLVNDESGEIELVLYYGKKTPDYVRSRFQGLFEEILFTRNVKVRKYAPIICPKCGRQQERQIVIQLIQKGKTFLFCPEDGKKIRLPKLSERIALNYEDAAIVARDEALSKMRTTYETALVRVKGFVRDRKDITIITCFVSYAWGNTADERWVLRLANDLRKADIDIVLDQWSNKAIGSNIPRFISQIEKSDFIVVIGTPNYFEKYNNKASEYGSVVAAEVDLINVRLIGIEKQKVSVLPLLLSGDRRMSFPPLLHGRVYADFRSEEYYFVNLFNLVLTLHHIPFDDPRFADLQTKLQEDARNLDFKRTTNW
jgi:small GTP-binding protein